MSTDNVCPFCGVSLESNTGSQCPACGSALPTRDSSAATIISKKAVFDNSAEAMDELKKLIRNGDSGAAAEVASIQFDLSQEAAQSTVEQVESDMKHSGRETPPAEPSPASAPPEVIDAALFDEPQKPNNSRRWIIGCSIGAAVFLCVCCCLPFLIWIVMMNKGR